jgi:hypothetical protein
VSRSRDSYALDERELALLDQLLAADAAVDDQAPSACPPSGPVEAAVRVQICRVDTALERILERTTPLRADASLAELLAARGDRSVPFADGPGS